MDVKPIYMDIPVIRLNVPGGPRTQKNDLIIKKRRGKEGKMVSFIGHSDRLESARSEAAVAMYGQYKGQGYSKPLGSFLDVDMVFYVLKAHEPDLDNLVPMFLDAMQGIKTKSGYIIAKILEDDKLVRRLSCEKIVKGDKRYAGSPRTEIEIRPYGEGSFTCRGDWGS